MTETKLGTEEELGQCIEDLLAQKKSEIERSLAEAIDQEREKARQRTAELEKEFAQGKEALGRHQGMLAEVAAATESVRERAGKHVEQAAHCRVMVRRLADKIGEECRNAEELGREMDDLLRKAGEETARVRSELESRYGLSVPVVDLAAHGGLGTDLEQALEKLYRYRDGLIALDGGGPLSQEVPASPEANAGIPQPGPAAGGNGVDPEAVSRLLELRLKTEVVPDVGAFRVYRNEGFAVLDASSIFEETDRFIREARAMHEQLAEAKSAKEQYYLKRDILSRQDSLRKILRRAVEMCEQEPCDLPLPTHDVLSVQTLKDIQDRLNVGNWSDSDDLDAFEALIVTLRTALSPMLADIGTYGKTILGQLHETL